MSEITRVLNQLRQAFDGEPWSGPSLLATLAGITAAQAARYPVAGAHSVWEIARHVGVWAEVVTRRIGAGAQRPVSDAEDWPPPPARPTEAAWQATLAELHAAHQRLLQAAAALPNAALDRPIGAAPGGSQAPGPSAYVLLHGVAQHYLYHAGQIALLRRALA